MIAVQNLKKSVCKLSLSITHVGKVPETEVAKDFTENIIDIEGARLKSSCYCNICQMADTSYINDMRLLLSQLSYQAFAGSLHHWTVVGVECHDIIPWYALLTIIDTMSFII